MGRAWPRARPSTAHRQGEGASSLQQVGRAGRGLGGPGWGGLPQIGCTTWGHWAWGCRGAGRTGKAASSPAGENTGGGREAATKATLRGKKVSDFLWGGGMSVSQSPYTWGRGPVRTSHSSRQRPPPPSWKSGKVTSGSAPSQDPQEAEVTHLGEKKGHQRREEALGRGRGGGCGRRGPPRERQGPLGGRGTQGREKEARGERVHWGRKGV